MNYPDLFDEIFKQFPEPKFLVKFWDGTVREYGAGTAPAFTLVIKDKLTARKILAQGSLGFGEAYMEGRLEIEGDLEAYISLRHKAKRLCPSTRLKLAALLARITMPLSRKGQIAYHYDIGNEFFKLILDNDTMLYSAGLYGNEAGDLAAAQKRKLEMICKWLALPAGASVLDLGAGWGGFAVYGAKNYQWNIHGLSLSQRQLEYCHELINKNGVQKLVSLELADMTKRLPARQFDGVVMIESIEHVGQKHLTDFFKKLAGALKPGAPLYIQTSGRYTPRPLDSWTLKYVFPGGYLPAKDELLSAAAAAGLTLEQFSDDTPDYIKTMSAWIENLESHRSEIEKTYGVPFYRIWELWTAGARAGFTIGTMNLFRLRLRKP